MPPAALIGTAQAAVKTEGQPMRLPIDEEDRVAELVARVVEQVNGTLARGGLIGGQAQADPVRLREGVCIRVMDVHPPLTGLQYMRALGLERVEAIAEEELIADRQRL